MTRGLLETGHRVGSPSRPLPAALEAALAAPARQEGDRWALELDLADPEQLFDYLDVVRQSGFVID
ncbi:MAG: hypothetical protein AB1609_18835 [Bacillota bacterium]